MEQLRIIRHFPKKHFLTLNTVCEVLEVKPYKLNELCIVVPDVLDSNRTLLWELEDYRVSSVSGGSIYLIKR